MTKSVKAFLFSKANVLAAQGACIERIDFGLLAGKHGNHELCDGNGHGSNASVTNVQFQGEITVLGEPSSLAKRFAALNFRSMTERRWCTTNGSTDRDGLFAYVSFAAHCTA